MPSPNRIRTRKCPSCDVILYYNYYYSWWNANKNNSLCKICSHPGPIKWNKANKDLLIKLWPTATSGELIRAFPGVNRHALSELARKANVKRVLNTRRHGDLYPLLSGSLESFYWIGFLFADGWLSKEGHLVCQLAIKDEQHLAKLATFLHTEVHHIKKGAIRVAVRDTVVANQIRVKFDWHHHKTDHPPTLDFISTNDQVVAFFAGYTDGDGSISKNGCSIRFQVHRTWMDLLNKLIPKLARAIGHTKPLPIARLAPKFCKSTGKIHQYTLIDIRGIELLESLNSRVRVLQLPILTRKWNRISDRSIRRELFRKST